MSDWIDSLANFFFELTSAVCEGRTQRQVIATIFASLAIFALAGTGIAMLAGAKLAAFGWWFLILSVFILAAASIWLFITDPNC